MNEQHDTNNTLESPSIADALERESERLHNLAEELKRREQLQAEMEANYPAFKAFVYAELRKSFKCEPLPDDKNLATWAAEQNAQPLETFIDEIEKKAN